jgi:hypothetical protein
MKTRKTSKLTKLALAGTMLFGSGCANNYESPEYHFDGEIDGEQLHFYEGLLTGRNYLEVTKADGSLVKYIDFERDLELDCVEITLEGNTSKYCSSSKNMDARQIVENEKPHFAEYLRKIMRVQTETLRR